METRRGTETIIAKALTGADAATEYKVKSREVRTLLPDLDRALLRHDKRQTTNPMDWSFVEDLGHVIKELKEVIRFVEGNKHE